MRFAFAICLVLAICGLHYAEYKFAAAPIPKDEEVVHLTLENVSAPFSSKAKVLVQQKDGKYKEYSPKDHNKFDKEVEALDLEITELHIKDREIIRLVFSKKLKESQ